MWLRRIGIGAVAIFFGAYLVAALAIQRGIPVKLEFFQVLKLETGTLVPMPLCAPQPIAAPTRGIACPAPQGQGPPKPSRPP